MRMKQSLSLPAGTRMSLAPISLMMALLFGSTAQAEGFYVGAGWMEDFNQDCHSGCELELERDSHGPGGLFGFEVGQDWVYGAELFLADGARGVAIGGGYRFDDLVTLQLGYMLGQERARLAVPNPEGGTDAQFHGPFVEVASPRAMAWLPMDFDSSLFLRIGQLDGKATRSQQAEEGPDDGGEEEFSQRYDYTSATLGVRVFF